MEKAKAAGTPREGPDSSGRSTGAAATYDRISAVFATASRFSTLTSTLT
jgi:hypothetical protein